jgi:hypothetical protein
MEAQVHNIFNLNTPKSFTEDEAYKLLNLLYIVTTKAKNKIQGLTSQMEFHKALPEQAQVYEDQINTEIQKWSEKVRRLGGTPMALYQVKVPTEGGFFFWDFPKVELELHLD